MRKQRKRGRPNAMLVWFIATWMTSASFANGQLETVGSRLSRPGDETEALTPAQANPAESFKPIFVDMSIDDFACEQDEESCESRSAVRSVG